MVVGESSYLFCHHLLGSPSSSSTLPFSQQETQDGEGAFFYFPPGTARTPKHLQVTHSNSRREGPAAAPTASASPSVSLFPPRVSAPTPLLSPSTPPPPPPPPRSARSRPLASPPVHSPRSTAVALGGHEAVVTTVVARVPPHPAGQGEPPLPRSLPGPSA